MDSSMQGQDAEVVDSIDAISDNDFKNYGRSVIVPNIPEKVLAAIGAKDKNVLIKRGVFAKNDISHKFTPEQSRAILSAALYAPNLVGPTQKTTRPDYRVVIRTGENRNSIVILDVSNTKDNLEIVGWYSLDERNLDRIKRQAIREGGELLILSPESVPAASLSALPDAGLSEDKGNENSEKASASSEKSYGAENKLVSSERYEELKKRMRAKLGQLNSGPDPEMLAIGCEMAMYHIEAGARKFADYTRAMISDLGDAVRPYLKSFYNGACDKWRSVAALYQKDMGDIDLVWGEECTGKSGNMVLLISQNSIQKFLITCRKFSTRWS